MARNPARDAEKALKAERKAERRAENVRATGFGWNMANPKGLNALEQANADVNRHLAEAKRQRERRGGGENTSGQTRRAGDKPAPKAPTEGGLRDRIKARNPAIQSTLDAKKNLAAQRQHTADHRLDKHDIAKLKPGERHPDADKAEKDHKAPLKVKGKTTETRVIPPVPGSKPPLPKTGPGSMDQDTRDRNPIPPNPNKGPGGTRTDVRTVGPKIPSRTPGYGPGPGGTILPKPKLPPTGPGTGDIMAQSKSGGDQEEKPKVKLSKPKMPDAPSSGSGGGDDGGNKDKRERPKSKGGVYKPKGDDEAPPPVEKDKRLRDAKGRLFLPAVDRVPDRTAAEADITEKTTIKLPKLVVGNPTKPKALKIPKTGVESLKSDVPPVRGRPPKSDKNPLLTREFETGGKTFPAKTTKTNPTKLKKVTGETVIPAAPKGVSKSEIDKWPEPPKNPAALEEVKRISQYFVPGVDAPPGPKRSVDQGKQVDYHHDYQTESGEKRRDEKGFAGQEPNQSEAGKEHGKVKQPKPPTKPGKPKVIAERTETRTVNELPKAFRVKIFEPTTRAAFKAEERHQKELDDYEIRKTQFGLSHKKKK